MGKYNKRTTIIWATIDPECVKQRISRINDQIEGVLSKYESQIIIDRLYSANDRSNQNRPLF